MMILNIDYLIIEKMMIRNIDYLIFKKSLKVKRKNRLKKIMRGISDEISLIL